MTVTEKLQSSFDERREPHLERLDFLRSLWLNPEFAEQCSLMFEQIWATTQEIIWQKYNLIAANDDIYESLHNLDLKRHRQYRTLILKTSKK